MRRRALRAAPRAAFVVTTVRLQSLPPSRLRRCALRLPPGDRREAHPRRAMLGAPRLPPNRRCRIGQASAHCNGQGVADTPQLAAAGCADACRPRRWRLSSIASRRMVRGHNARPRYGASTPRLNGAAGCDGDVLACRWSVGLARVRARAAEAFVRGCRVGHASFRSGSAQGVLVSL